MSLPAIVDAVLDLVEPQPTSTTISTESSKLLLPKLVYLGTANYDNSESFAQQTKGYKNKCRIVQLKLSERIPIDRMPTKAEMRVLIASADILMVSGGNTLYALNRWKHLGVDRMIRDAVYDDKVTTRSPVLCGGSAGAVCWFDQGHSDSMNPTTLLNVDPNLTEEEKTDWEYIKVEGLNLLPAVCVPHHDVTLSNGQPRAQAANHFLLSQYHEQHIDDSKNSTIYSALPPCIGIDEKAALVVSNGMVRVVSGAKQVEAACHVMRVVEVGCQDDPRQSSSSISVVTTDFGQGHGSIPLKDLLAGKVPTLARRE